MRFAPFAILCVLLHTAPASAWDERHNLRDPALLPIEAVNLPPRPAPEGWRRVASFGGGSDSDCIGHPRTPTCAIDTWQACRATRDLYLCNIALPGIFSPARAAEVAPTRWPIFNIVDYKIVGVSPFKTSHIPNNVRSHWIPREGDLLAGVVIRRCSSDIEQAPEKIRWVCDSPRAINVQLFHLRRIRGMWQVVDANVPDYPYGDDWVPAATAGN